MSYMDLPGFVSSREDSPTARSGSPSIGTGSEGSYRSQSLDFGFLLSLPLEDRVPSPDGESGSVDGSRSGPLSDASPRPVSPVPSRSQPVRSVRAGRRLSRDSAYDHVTSGDIPGDDYLYEDDERNDFDPAYEEETDDMEYIAELVARHATFRRLARETRDDVSRFYDLYRSYLRTKGSWFEETLLYVSLEHIAGDMLVVTEEAEWIIERDPITGNSDVLKLQIDKLVYYVDKCYYHIQMGKYLMARGPSVTEILRGVVPYRIQSAATTLRDICARLGHVARYIVGDPRVSIVLRRDGEDRGWSRE